MFILLCFVLVTWRTPQTFQLTGILGTVFVDSVDCMLNAQCHFLSPSSSKKKPGLKILPSCINVCTDCRGGSCGQTNMLQICWRSYLEWTWNFRNQSHRNHIRTGHEALEGQPVCAGGSRLQDEIILEPQLQNTNIRCNQICCSFISTEQRRHFIKMSGRQRWTKQYVQPCSPFLAIVRKGHYPPSEVWADRCLSLSTAHRTVSKVLWRCAKIYRRIQNDTQLDWTSLRLRWTWIPWEVKSRVDLGFYGGSARKGWTVGHSPRKQRLQQGEGKGKNVQEMHSVTTCYNFTSQKCNRNGNATLSLSRFLCQCINVVSPTGGSPWGEAQGLDSSHMGHNVTSRKLLRCLSHLSHLLHASFMNVLYCPVTFSI